MYQGDVALRKVKSLNILKNAFYLNETGNFVKGDIAVENGTIQAVGAVSPKTRCTETDDFDGCRIIPGLIDIHIHGAVGYDVSSANAGEICEVSHFLARHGVTSFCPTTATAEMNSVYKAMRNIRAASEMDNLGASIVGVHMEGPYISPRRKGCHDSNLLRAPEAHEFDTMRELLGDKLKLRITLAPEIDGAGAFIRYACAHGGMVSIGHSDADEKTALTAITYGANSFTHLFNAMSGIHHREPGCAGAGLLSDAYVELICDGIHIHPDMIQLAYRIKKPGTVIAITDAMHATGGSDGEYTFCGMKIKVEGGIARLPDGTLAGSTLLLFDGVKNLMKFAGISFAEAIRAATVNPAKLIGIYDRAGSIEQGKNADFAVVDNNLNLVCTFCKGKKIMPE